MKHQKGKRYVKRQNIKVKLSPKAKAFAGCAIGAAGISVGLFYILPLYETFGTLWTMISAMLTGIFYTRLSQTKKKE